MRLKAEVPDETRLQLLLRLEAQERDKRRPDPRYLEDLALSIAQEQAIEDCKAERQRKIERSAQPPSV